MDLADALDNPRSLIDLPLERFDQLVEQFCATGEPMMAAFRRAAGLIAWAARFQYPDSHYGPRIHRLAERLGFSDDTVTRWRDQVIRDLGLPVPAVTRERSRARLQAAARQVRRNTAVAPPPPAPAWAQDDADADFSGALEVGEIQHPAVHQAIAMLLTHSPEALADAPTEHLRQLRDLVNGALAYQRREALHARLAAQDRTAGRTGTSS